MHLIVNEDAPSNLRAGAAQLAIAVVLLTFLLFASGWRMLATLEVAAYFVLSGGALIIYGSLRREIPFGKLASTWLPIYPQILVIFLVSFGSGVGLAEAGHDSAGIALITLGYVSLGARSAIRLLGRSLGD